MENLLKHIILSEEAPAKAPKGTLWVRPIEVNGTDAKDMYKSKPCLIYKKTGGNSFVTYDDMDLPHDTSYQVLSVSQYLSKDFKELLAAPIGWAAVGFIDSLSMEEYIENIPEEDLLKLYNKE